MSAAVNTVVIVGRDAPLWMAANALGLAFQKTGLKLEIVELPGQHRHHDVLMSLPPLESFHRLLGVEENFLIKACAGSYSLGQQFNNFSGPRKSWFHPYGGHGVNIDKLPFSQFWIKGRLSGMPVEFEDFSMTAAAAKYGRFFRPNADIGSFTRCEYGYHLEAKPYAECLKAQALGLGLTVTKTRHVDVRLDGETGDIEAILTGDGREIVGDLFIDATGAESLLLGGALQVGFESWSHWFPFDRLLSVGSHPLKSIPPYSQVRAMEAGCLHIAPTQAITNLTYAYHGEAIADQAALETVAVVGNLPLLPDAVVSPLKIGRRVKAWEKNCIAIGEAACVLDPIDNPGLHCVHVGLAHLMSSMPRTRACALEASAYDRLMVQVHERMRDFQMSHYKLNQNYDQPYWDALRAMEVPQSLAWKIALFEARGVVASLDEDVFETDDWISLFVGHGVMPRTYDPLIDLTSQDAAIQNFQRMLGFIKQHVQAMSSHDAYLEFNA